MNKQLNIDYLLKPTFKFTHRPIRLFEAFAGIGCQAMALKRIGIDYETIGISEIDKYAIQSYNAIHGETQNYGDISKMVEIPQCDIFTYSFPCTDLSKAGKQKGLNGTRSGLVYEVLRLLNSTKDKPKVLIMENVVDLIQTKFIREFQEIQHEIEKLGYTNYVQTLNAKDYGVAQNRDRVFMVSILGDYYYEFPKPIKLEKRLRDYLEETVDEKYYLSAKMLKFFIENSKNNEEKGNGFRFSPQDGSKEAKTITTLTGNRMDDNFIIGSTQKNAYIGSTNKECPTLTSAMGQDGGHIPMITEPKLIQVAQIESKGFNKTSGRVYSKDGLSPTIQTLQGGNREPKIVDIKSQDKYYAKPNGEIAPTQYAQEHYAIIEEHYIRKLTPLECWRLMGINDEDFYKAQSVCSNSQLYKQAGNGIVVDVFAAILKNLFELGEEDGS